MRIPGEWKGKRWSVAKGCAECNGSKRDRGVVGRQGRPQARGWGDGVTWSLYTNEHDTVSAMVGARWMQRSDI